MARINSLKINVIGNPKKEGLLFTGKNPFYIENLIQSKDGTLKSIPKLNKILDKNFHTVYKNYLVANENGIDTLYYFDNNTLIKLLDNLGSSDNITIFTEFNDIVFLTSKYYGNTYAFKYTNLIEFQDILNIGEILTSTDIRLIDAISFIRPYSFIHSAFGRLFGSVNNTLFYSEPYSPNITKKSNYIEFNSEIQFITSTSKYISVATKDTLYLISPELSVEKVYNNIYSLYGVPHYTGNFLIFLTVKGIYILNEYTTGLALVNIDTYNFNFDTESKYYIFSFDETNLIFSIRN